MTTNLPQVKRRELLKAGIAASAAMTVGIPVSEVAKAAAGAAENGIVWTKGVCRFCGTGCGLSVGVKDGRVVATKGDPDAPVNRGLNCIKGYFNAKILYGKDRLTKPLLRKTNGKYDKNGKFEAVSWEEALDVMADKFLQTYKAKGPTAVAILGSGQYTIPEAYAASKLVKAGWRSNNLDPNARLCMASAVVGFYQVFGIDEPANNYSDIEKCNTMVLWGNNMAEAHPVLWSRVADRKLTHAATKIINVTTYKNMSSNLADTTIIFKPNTDLAILNYILREIVNRGAVEQDFVNKHCIFATGNVDIGYGMRPTDKFAFPAEKDVQKKQNEIVLDKWEAIAQGRKEGQVVKQVQQGGKAGGHWSITFEEFKKGLEPYTLDFVAELSKGDPDESMEDFKKKLVALADTYIDKANDILSFWCMGANQHQRGVWVNEQIYAVHLLLAKHARPGNGAFSLTGQPSACGSAREVGTFCHRLPSDLLVAAKPARVKSEKIWGIPEKTINPKVGRAFMEILRGMEDDSVNFVWTQVVNPFQAAPNSNHWLKAARHPNNFIVVADAYPTYSCRYADLILPAAMIFEKWGLYGNAERRTQGWQQMATPPGEARTDLWMMMEFAKRIKLKDVWGEQSVPGLKVEGYEDGKLPSVLDEAQKMGYTPETTLYEVLYARKSNTNVAWPDPAFVCKINSTAAPSKLNWFPEKALFSEYRQFTLGDGHDLADFDTYLNSKTRGLMWPVVNGKETPYRFNQDFDPYVKEGGYAFYGKLFKAIPTGNLWGITDPKPVPLPNKAKIFYRPYAAPVEQPDANYDLWLCTGRILEHWHTGSMTMRVPELYRAQPNAFVYMNPDDAAKRGLKNGDVATVESRRGKINAIVQTNQRNFMPKGSSWLAFFDEKVQTNQVVIDATDPISEEPDFKKSAVKIYKAQ
ncbi:nitrate reductase catalytic subunit NapA [Turicimonas muris]|uniref:Periplasmic nitrate reductase n=5 Tax=Turicimonas muris TaxID=1796652 RepID=A0A227KPV0_9BURK|nr:nitrate reductase catalytic subunit NapA [Turicimonas muris]ANU66341.1 periplasmic nitrate reductase subunit alpha [Burkholderiales bacterium YL45]OXE50251.1 periplasmic nitrate reductase subunit alpha [Turicimonas muris]QQQ97483.1 nitrate reductase catalytic subunit NapA [Turicimonas muris]